MIIKFYIFLFLTFNYQRSYVKATVLAIDYGQEWIKAAIVKHGIPIEIVLTKESKRKDRSVIMFNGDERLYGIRAEDMAYKDPSSAFFSLKSLIGKPYDSKEVKDYLSLYQNVVMIPNKDGLGVAFMQNNKTFTVEELTAMLFENYKIMAENIVEEKIKDVVITVPSFFTEIERHAILDAAKIAGLNILSLVNEGYAIAINYATTRIFDKEDQYHIFYDMGAGSSTATFVSYKSKTFSNNKTMTVMKVLGVGYNRHLGGDVFTWKLVDYLLNEFTRLKGSEIKEPIKLNSKAITKLFKESSRIKQILSVNSDAHILIENLHENIDYNIRITRETFEKLLESFSEQIKKTLTSSVEMTPIPLRLVKSVILVGGGARVPFVQKQIESLVGAEKVAKSVNADEAAVMGAVFRGAGLSGRFRVKNIKSLDIILNSVFITYPDVDNKMKTITHSLFLKGSKLETEKTLSFIMIDDFEIELSHVVGFHLPGTTFSKFKLTGFNESINSLKQVFECKNFSTEVTFKLDLSGLVSINNASLKCVTEKENKEAYLNNLIKNKFDRFEADDFNEDRSSYTPNINHTKIEEEKKKTRKLNFNIEYTNMNPKNRASILASINILKDLKELDKKRIARDEARNKLESYIYSIQELLEIDEFIAVSTKEQRDELLNVVEKVKEYLNINEETLTLDELTKHQKSIEALEIPISERKNDARERSVKISELKSRIESFKHFLNNLPIEELESPLDDTSSGDSNPTLDNILNNLQFGAQRVIPKIKEPGFKPETIEIYRENLYKIEKWLEESIIAQEVLKPWEPSKLKVKDILSKIWELEETKENIRIMEQIYLKSRHIMKQAKKESSTIESTPTVSIKSDATSSLSTNATSSLPTNATSSLPINTTNTTSESTTHNEFL